MKVHEISIGLSAWIIQDGNYGDFRVGEQTRFALELHPHTLGETRNTEPFLDHLGAGRYHGRGLVVFAGKETWVLDCCGVLAFKDRPPARGVQEGTFLEGELSLAIDPFSYFERLFRLREMPALTYDVRIDEVLLETTPWRTRKIGGQTIQERVAHRVSHAPIQETAAWTDDGGQAEYVLRCALLGGPSHPPHSDLSLRQGR